MFQSIDRDSILLRGRVIAMSWQIERRSSRNELIAILLCSVIIVGTMLAPRGVGSGEAFDHIVVILMENHGIDSVYNCGTDCSYMTSLADSYSLALHYTAIDHPSEPNYLALFSGTTNGGGNAGSSNSSPDCSPSSSCTGGSTPNLVDRLEAKGLTWSAYAADLGPPIQSSNQCTGTNPYPSFNTVRHFPFFYFTDITSSSERCGHTYHSTEGPSTDSPCTSNCDPELVAELNGPSPANFVWLTPNDCNNMHGTSSCPKSVATGNAYLAALVPQILASTTFTATRAALFIVFDEGSSSYPSDYVYAVWAGSAARNGLKSTSSYNHYSFLKTLETVWGLQSLESTDANAASMTEFLNGSSTPSSPPGLVIPMPLILLSGAAGIAIIGGGLIYAMRRRARRRGSAR